MALRALSQEAEIPDVDGRLAVAYSEAGQTDKSLAIYSRLLEKSPNNWVYLNNQAYLLLGQPGRADEAVALAYANNCALQRMPARYPRYHFQLICFDGSGSEYIYNLYPTVQRIYSDPKHRGPFLKVNRPWTLLDVVKAKVESE